MSSTYKPQRAFDYAKSFIKDMPIGRDNLAVTICDDISKHLWMAAPWRWTLGSYPNFTLVADTPTYAGITIPADYLRLESAYLTDGSKTPRPLTIEPFLPEFVTIKGQVSRIAVDTSPPSSHTIRVSPVPGTLTSPAPVVVTSYKKVAPDITAAAMNTAGVQVFDDEWFWVFQEGVLWKAYLYADDARAGNIRVDAKGNIEYTGQRAAFEAAIEFMKKNEKLPELTGASV